jgi:hypothetical protein
MRSRTLTLVATATAILFGMSGAAARAADLTATPATLASVYAGAHGGDVIHLSAGNYGTFSGGSKPSTVILTPVSGLPASSVILSADLTPSDHLQIDGVTVDGATLDGAHDVAFTNDVFTKQAVVYRSPVNSNTLFDHDSFDNINVCSKCFTGRITLVDATSGDGVNPDGVLITNSHFSGGDSDGVDLFGQTMGAQIGPGNEFVNLDQTDAQHTDPIQTYGGAGTIVGNWIHDDATSIMAPDGTDPPGMIIADNVCTRIEQQCAYLGYKQNVLVDHNTFTKGLLFNDAPTKSGTRTSGVVVKNNVLQGGLIKMNLLGGALSQENYNLLSGGGGTGNHDLSGNAKFTGGANPGTWGGFQLVGGSLGTHAADDGTDMGADFSGKPFPIPGPVTPGAGGGGGGGAGAGGVLLHPPALTLTTPKPGKRFRRRIRMAVTASSSKGIRRVEFWVDRRRVGVDKTAPYARTWRIPRHFRRGAHTVSARAVGRDGNVSSVAVTISIGRRAHGARARAWRLSSTPVAGGRTLVLGHGPARRRVRVLLGSCHRHPRRIAQRLRLRAGPHGGVLGHARAGMCVLALHPR